MTDTMLSQHVATLQELEKAKKRIAEMEQEGSIALNSTLALSHELQSLRESLAKAESLRDRLALAEVQVEELRVAFDELRVEQTRADAERAAARVEANVHKRMLSREQQSHERTRQRISVLRDFATRLIYKMPPLSDNSQADSDMRSDLLRELTVLLRGDAS